MGDLMIKFLENIIFKNENLNFNLFFMLILLIISCFIVYFRFGIQIILGPGWDTFDFLLNALEFSGKGFGYYDLSRPPFLSFLTGLFFIFGYVSESVIFLLDGILFIFGAIGLYFLLKIRFNFILSFLGTLLFILNPLILQWVTVGYSDIASVSFLIWSAYFLFNKNGKSSVNMYLSSLFFAFSFLTRYSSGLFIFPVILYFLMERSSYHFKDILKYVSIFLMAIAPFMIFFYLKFDNPFPFINIFSSTTISSSIQYWAYNDDIYYFIKNLISFLSFTYLGGFILIFSILIGFITSLFKIIKKSPILKINKKEIDLNRHLTLIFLLILILLFFITLNNVWYMLSEVIFLIICYLSFEFLKDGKNDKKMELFFIIWFMTFFIFHSVYTIKVDRYFISFLPPLMFFIIFGLNKLYNLFRAKFSLKIARVSLCFLVGLILLFNIVPSTLWLIDNYYNVNSSGNMYPEVKEAIEGSKWISNNVPEYNKKIIYSDFLWPHFSWYLKMKVNSLIIENITSINDSLNKIHVDYYLSSYYNESLDSYRKKLEIGNLTIFEKI